jgi:hypothetical protein
MLHRSAIAAQQSQSHCNIIALQQKRYVVLQRSINPMGGFWQSMLGPRLGSLPDVHHLPPVAIHSSNESPL